MEKILTDHDGVKKVEESLSTLLWEIWEKKGIYKREIINRYDWTM